MNEDQKRESKAREVMIALVMVLLVTVLFVVQPPLLRQNRLAEFLLVLGVIVVAEMLLSLYLMGPERRAKALRLVREHIGQTLSGKWTCSNCGMKNEAKSLRCDNCNALNPTKVWECPICETSVTKDLGICPGCGSTRPEPE